MAGVFAGVRRFRDEDSGEIIEVPTFVREVGDVGFHKIWLAEILDLVDEVGNQKMRVLMWLLANADMQNRISATGAEIAEATGVSRATITALMSKMREANIITRVRQSLWRLNPDVIFKGKHGARMGVLHIYQQEQLAQGDLFEKPKQEKADRPTPRPAAHLTAVQ